MSTPDYSPDGLTYDDITAIQREVTAELRREGHLPRPRHIRRRRPASRPRDAARARPDHALAPPHSGTARPAAR